MCEKIRYQLPLQNKLFFIVIHRFSLVKVAGATGICKLCSVVNKWPLCLYFPIVKGVTKTIAQKKKN
jgi:hypothetical protein